MTARSMLTMPVLLVVCALRLPAIAAEGNAVHGQQAFRACAACHALEPDRNMTGPSLANLWGRRAGGLVPTFSSLVSDDSRSG